MYQLVLFFFALTTSLQAAIFGADDRVSIRPGSMGYELSRSTAVALLTSNYEVREDGRLKLFTDRLDSWLCRENRFADSPSLAYACSGFLVAPNLIVTAGHCMVNTGVSRNETETYCQAFSWLFDFHEQSDPENFPAENLYRCKQVVYAVKDEGYPYRDYALVELDRPVVGRTPLPLNSANLRRTERFSMIGHPMGMPSKLSRNARLFLDDPERESFITNLDAFSGNSGSAVFNSRNEVVGILIAGTPSHDTLKKGQCQVYNRCSEMGTSCRLPDEDTSLFNGHQHVGSEVQRIGPVLELIEDFQAQEL